MEREERTYGIQAFDTPEEAFGLMASSWSDRDEESMQILNDREFCRVICRWRSDAYCIFINCYYKV